MNKAIVYAVPVGAAGGALLSLAGLVPLVIGIAALGTIFLVLRTFWRRHHRREQAPVAPGA